MTVIDQTSTEFDDPDRVGLDHRLAQLEAHAIFVIREVAAENERPVLLFSGGKDSVVMLHLAKRAFEPGVIPFPVMHVDTGHNFAEVIEFRDRLVEQMGVRLVVASVQDAIDEGRVADPGPTGSRNRLQTEPLLHEIGRHKFDAAFGGARRDEDKARAKERILSFRDLFGQWDPKNQRPELWRLYNPRVRPASTCGPSRSVTGPSSTSGVTSPSTASSCRRCTTRTNAKWSLVTGCCSPRAM